MPALDDTIAELDETFKVILSIPEKSAERNVILGTPNTLEILIRDINSRFPQFVGINSQISYTLRTIFVNYLFCRIHTCNTCGVLYVYSHVDA